ncbi:MAG: hypothetical protein Ct9H300mP1_22040 [Planctomycetaceae bacterium]|nr:MAG: hypothetical protein Ct9H300mP1_22040 [Planctomycetaceae bacterium]
MTATTTAPQVCTRCIMDETVSGITFDDQGVCNHCHIHDTLDRLYPLNDEGHRELLAIVEQIKRDGRGRPPRLHRRHQRRTRHLLLPLHDQTARPQTTGGALR